MRQAGQSENRGFTIVELITIIVIIGILATIGIMSWTGAQNKAKYNSYLSTAEQVKLKLGEYFTEKNKYPGTEAEVSQYLQDIGSASLKTEFDTSPYVYEARGASNAACTTAGPTYCTTYTITVQKSHWNGGASDADISVRP